MSADFDPHALIAKSQRGTLRIGEAEALALYVRKLEREVASAQVVREAAASEKAVLVALTAEGSLAVTFPGAKPHTVTVPPGAIGFDFILRALRERNGKPHYIASPGAPTQAELVALARASKKKPNAHIVHELDLSDLNL